MSAGWRRLRYRVYVDWVRSCPEHQRRRNPEGGRIAHQVPVVSLDDEREHSATTQAGTDPASAAALRQVLVQLEANDFPADQRQAIYLWLQGHTAEECAAILQLSGADQARRLPKTSRQRLRRAVTTATQSTTAALESNGVLR